MTHPISGGRSTAVCIDLDALECSKQCHHAKGHMHILSVTLHHRYNSQSVDVHILVNQQVVIWSWLWTSSLQLQHVAYLLWSSCFWAAAILM